VVGHAEVDAALGRFAALDDQALSRSWMYRGKPMDVRYALYRTIEDAQVALVRLVTLPHPESRRILALAQRAFGDLRGLLVGLPDSLLDRSPREGEWTLREILRHIIVIEGRYMVQTEYAVERADSDPMRVADDRMPTPSQTDVTGGIVAILARVREARGRTNRRLGDLTAPAMVRPTQWMQYDADVRFRLHRFAAHMVEHTVHVEKTLGALGCTLTEGRLIVRRLTGLVGELEGQGGEAEAREIEERLVERQSVATA